MNNSYQTYDVRKIYSAYRRKVILKIILVIIASVVSAIFGALICFRYTDSVIFSALCGVFLLFCSLLGGHISVLIGSANERKCIEELELILRTDERFTTIITSPVSSSEDSRIELIEAQLAQSIQDKQKAFAVSYPLIPFFLSMLCVAAFFGIPYLQHIATDFAEYRSDDKHFAPEVKALVEIVNDPSLPSEVRESIQSVLSELEANNDKGDGKTSPELLSAIENAKEKINEFEKNPEKFLENTPTPTPTVTPDASKQKSEKQKEQDQQQQDNKTQNPDSKKGNKDSQSQNKEGEQGDKNKQSEGKDQQGEQKQDQTNQQDSNKQEKDSNQQDGQKGDQKENQGDQKEGQKKDQQNEGQKDGDKKNDQSGKEQDKQGQKNEQQSGDSKQSEGKQSEGQENKEQQKDGQKSSQGSDKDSKGDPSKEGKEPGGNQKLEAAKKSLDDLKNKKDQNSGQNAGSPAEKPEKKDSKDKPSEQKKSGDQSGAGLSKAKEQELSLRGEDDQKGGQGLSPKKIEEKKLGNPDEKTDERYTGNDVKISDNKDPAKLKTEIGKLEKLENQAVSDSRVDKIPLEYKEFLN